MDTEALRHPVLRIGEREPIAPYRIRAFCGRCSTTSWVPSESWIL